MSTLLSPRNFVSSLISSISTQPTTSNLAQTSNPLKDATPNVQKALLTLHVLFPNEVLPALDLLDRGLVTRLTVQHEAQQRQPPDSQPQLPLHEEEDDHQQRQEVQPAPQEPLEQRSERHSRPGLGGHGLRQPSELGLPRLQEIQQPQEESQAPAEDPQDGAPVATSRASHQIRHQRAQSQGQRLDQQDPSLHRGPSAAEVEDQLTDVLSIRNAKSQTFVCRSGAKQDRLHLPLKHVSSYEVRLDAWSCSCPAFAFSAFPATTSETTHDDIASARHTHSNIESNWTFGGLTLGTDMPVCKHILACILVEHCSIFASFVEQREVSIEELAGWAAGWGD